MRDSERRVFDGDPLPAYRSRRRLALAAAVALGLPGCMFVANLGQFDGAVEVHDGGPDVVADTSAEPDVGNDDVTGVDVIEEASLDAGDADSSADVAQNDGPCIPMWPAGGTNVITNPDFEEGGAGWFALYGGTFSATSATAYCGSSSGELSGRQQFFNALATTLPTTPATYNVALWVRYHSATSPLQASIGGVCEDVDGGPINFLPGPTPTVAADVWTFVSGSMTVPQGCATMVFFVGQPTNAVAPFPDIFADEVFVGQ
jgi:hypothetical protein